MERISLQYLYQTILLCCSEMKGRSEEHTSELQSQSNLVCRLLLEKKTHNSSISCCVSQFRKTEVPCAKEKYGPPSIAMNRCPLCSKVAFNHLSYPTRLPSSPPTTV